MTDFKEWNKAFTKLRYKHDTWYIFRDWLDMTIDQFTIPDQKPLFENRDKYTPEEYGLFGDLFHAYIGTMHTELETRPYYDFLGEWWEADQDMTNKFNAQFFTPMSITDLMCQVTLDPKLGEQPKVMYDCCCGSGRFALAHHHYRPQDYFFLNDLDQYAVKMTIVNMLFHGMQGVVAHMNTLTEEVMSVWRVTPYLFEFSGVPYVVPFGTDLDAALSFLPKEEVVESPSIPLNSDKTETCGGLDKWLQT